MARQARQQSQSGIYHLILRGINKQVIFEDDEDRGKFLWCLRYYKEPGRYQVYGYCLMSNHIHLLIKEGKEPIATTMKRIGVSYVSWFNRKYERCGHLFQDRFRSEPVENDAYFLTVLRYIHQNPVKSGETNKAEESQWSSYRAYLGEGGLVDTDFALALFSSEREIAVSRLAGFMNEKAEDIDMILYRPNKMTDQEAELVIQKVAGVSSGELQGMERRKRDEILRDIKQIDGITTRQLARLTGITQSVIVRV